MIAPIDAPIDISIKLPSLIFPKVPRLKDSGFKNAEIAMAEDFSYHTGDSIQISVFKQNYLVLPEGLKIAESEAINFSLYNVYGRENAFQINFQDDPKDLSRTQIIQTSLFRWVPSVTYQFKF